jgi:hypothetical protein
MCGPLDSSGPTHSPTIDSHDCMAMWELNPNVKREYLTNVRSSALIASQFFDCSFLGGS